MAEKTGIRLDTVDIADGSGWQVESTHEADLFTKSTVTIAVRYSASDDIESAAKRVEHGAAEAIEAGRRTRLCGLGLGLPAGRTAAHGR